MTSSANTRLPISDDVEAVLPAAISRAHDWLKSTADEEDKATEQRVGGTRRHTQQPSEKVPNNAADKTGKNHHQQCLAVSVCCGAGQVIGIEVNNAFRYGRSNIDRKEGTNQVKDCGDCHRSKWLQSTGGNGRSHRVGSVMKSVRKVKGKGGNHHNAEDDQSRCHSVGPLERKR